MAARVAQVEGQKANPSNFLLMHAMGPNVAGVIGSAVAAGIFLILLATKSTVSNKAEEGIETTEKDINRRK